MNKLTGILLILFLTFLPSCGIDPLSGFESPDNTKIALVYIKRFNKSTTHVSIIAKNENTPAEGNVAMFKGIVNLEIEWKNNFEMKIIIPESDKGKIISFNKQIENIAVIIEQK